MSKYRNFYTCPCGNRWFDDWDSMCDDRCPICSTSCSPDSSDDLETTQPNNEETEEECAARLRKISEEVKADIKAGRYKNGQVHEHIRATPASEGGTITGRWTQTRPIMEELIRAYSGREATDFFRELFATPIPERRSPGKKAMDFLHMYGANPRTIIADDSHHMRGEDLWFGRRERFDWPCPAVFDRLEPKPEPDWKRTKFVSGSASTPSETLRKKLREERKKKKGHKK